MLAWVPSVKTCSLWLNCMECERNEAWVTTKLKDNLNSFSTDQKTGKIDDIFIFFNIFTVINSSVLSYTSSEEEKISFEKLIILTPRNLLVS